MTDKYRGKSGSYGIFTGVEQELAKAQFNVINFEGAATGARFPLVPKQYLLPMPLFVDRILADARIKVATLANNHAMDFGLPGLFDTLSTLRRSGIQYAGAGFNESQAIQPAVVNAREGSICILNFSRTLPDEHWARGNSPGTANLSFSKTAKKITACTEKYDYTFVVYHWGSEGKNEIKPYQKRLAHLSIDSGATAVIGHHPHVLQPIEVYKNRPILYSIGNFAFASNPNSSIQQGVGARFYLGKDGVDSLKLIPLRVSFPEVKGRPEVFQKNVTSTYLDSFALEPQCVQKGPHAIRTCTFVSATP